MGDRWKSSNLGSSTYVWLPLTLSGTTASLPSSASPWVPNVAAGTWSAAPSTTSYEGESSSNTISGGAKTVSCSGCSGGTALGYIGGPSGGTLVFHNVQSSATTTSTLQIYYANGDAATRYATVTVNGVAHEVAFVSTGTGQSVIPAVVTVNLNSGTGNTITIAGVGGGLYGEFHITGRKISGKTKLNAPAGPDVDRIVVPTS